MTHRTKLPSTIPVARAIATTLTAKEPAGALTSARRGSLNCGMTVIQQIATSDSITRYTGSGPAKEHIMWVVGAAMYVLPTMLAWKRGSSRKWKVTLINVLLGWTVIGWIVAMALTFAYEPPPTDSEPDVEYEPGHRL